MYGACGELCGPRGRRGRRRATAVCLQRVCTRGRTRRQTTQEQISAREEELTQNMPRMVWTREVSQREMSALKECKFWKSKLMSVTPETHQSAMGPYFAIAAAAFELYSVAAVLRETLLVKIWPEQRGVSQTYFCLPVQRLSFQPGGLILK